MSTIVFYGQFIATKVGLDGLTVTVDIERVTRSDGTRSALVTGGSATGVGRRGLYYYRQTSADLTLYDYVATFITADATVDQKEVAALWTHYGEESTLATGQSTNTASFDNAALDQFFTTNTGLTWGDAVAGSVVSEILDGNDPGTFNAAAVWTYANRTLTTPAASIISAVRGDRLRITIASTWNATITGLPSNTGYVSLLLTIKKTKDDADTASILQIRKNASALSDGLMYINGAAPGTPLTSADASITVNSATSLTFIISAAATSYLSPADEYVYDIKYVMASSAVQESEGVIDIAYGVTRAII